jgi:hypothetical protein
MQPMTIPLPENWPRVVKAAMPHVIALAHKAVTFSRGWCANSPLERVRLRGENDRLRSELAAEKEVTRILSARFRRIEPRHRPRYTGPERMAILELRAACGWTVRQTADTFLVDPDTVSAWSRRVNELGPDRLLEIPVPVNRFPDYLRYAVQRLKVLCPALGKVTPCVQPAPSAHIPRWRNTGGNLLRHPSRQSAPPIRTQRTLARPKSLRQSASSCAWWSRRTLHPRNRLPRRPQASAHCQAPARRLKSGANTVFGKRRNRTTMP